jgi:hypothetical protein
MLWQDLWESYSRNLRSVRALLACRALIYRSKKRTLRSLHQCCRIFIGRSCSDDRDEVYADTGLAKDDLAIITDYNLSSNKVCLDFARKSLLSGDFSVLHLASTSWLDPSCELTASFVARLESQQSHDSPSPLGGLDTPRHCAGKQRKPAVRLSRPLAVDIRGLRIDTVCHVESFTAVIVDLPVGRGSPLRLQLLELYHRVKSIYRSTAGVYDPTSTQAASLKLAFWRTIHLGWCPRRHEAQYVPTTDFRFLDLNDRLNIAVALNKPVLFVTSLGLLGLGPPWLEERDTVVVSGGAETPFVLRPFKNEGGDGEWKVVGDCYLEGCMDGKYFGFDIRDDGSSAMNGTLNHGRDGKPAQSSGSVERNVLKGELFKLC